MSNRLACSLLVLGLFSAPAVPGSQDRHESELAQDRAMFERYTPETFDLGGELSRYVHKHFSAFYRNAIIARTGEARPLPVRSQASIANAPVKGREGETSLANYVSNNPFVDAMIVMQNGEIVFESYPRMEPWDRHLAWSVTKMVSTAAAATLEQNGKLDQEQPVEHYLPELDGTAWAGTRVRDIANMASGMDCLDSDGYQNTETCIYRLEESLGLVVKANEPVLTLDHLRGITRKGPAGDRYEYTSANTHIMGLLVERITNKPFRLAVQDMVWGPMGAESDALMMVSPEGQSMAHSGLSLRLRDLARFGLFLLEDGGRVFAGATRPENSIIFGPDFEGAQKSRYGEDLPARAASQWDAIWDDGVMFKGGYSGQGLFVDPARDVVIAYFGTYGEGYVGHDLAQISRNLLRSGILGD